MITHNMPMSDYLAHPGINSSRLKLMLKTSLDFKASYEVQNEDTKSTILGTAAHTLLLEPDEFYKRYALQLEDYGNKSVGKKNDPESPKQRWEAFKKANVDKIVLDKKESDKLLKLKEKVEKNINLRFILASGKPEVTGIVQEANGLTLKARADLLTKNTIWDVKTTLDGIDDLSLYRTIKKYNYHFSAAHYMRVFNKILNDSILYFGWIFVDTDSPAMHIRMLRCPVSLLNKGILQHENAIKRLLECFKTGLYQGYSEQVEELQLPKWANEYE